MVWCGVCDMVRCVVTVRTCLFGFLDRLFGFD